MQNLEVSGPVRPLKWSLGVKWLIVITRSVSSYRQYSSSFFEVRHPRCVSPTVQDNTRVFWFQPPHVIVATALSQARSGLHPQPGLHKKIVSKTDNLDNRQHFSYLRFLCSVHSVTEETKWTMDTVGPQSCKHKKLYILSIAI